MPGQQQPEINPTPDKRWDNLKPPYSSTNQPKRRNPRKGKKISTVLKMLRDCKAPAEAEKIIREAYPEIPKNEKITRAFMYAATLDSFAVSRKSPAATLRAQEDILAYTEGKPIQSVDVSTLGESLNPKDVFKFEIFNGAKSNDPTSGKTSTISSEPKKDGNI